MSAKAKEISSNVASQVNDMNAKVLAVADSRAVNSGTGVDSPKPAATAAPSAGGGGGGGVNTIATASREELVEVLQKMNKKVKALNTLRTQMTEKAEAAEKDRDKLIAIFQTQILQGMDLSSFEDPSQSQTDQLLALWAKKDKLHRDEMDALRSQIQTLQSGVNGGTPSSVDVMELRQQLQMEHDRAMAAVKEQHANEMAQLKELVSNASSSSPNDSNSNLSETIETLQKSHDEAMEKLKKAAALQMQTFKKKVAAARTAELEKIVKETRDQVTEELKGSMSSAEDANKVREELEKKHVAALEKVKAETMAQMAKDTEAQVNKLLTTMNNQAKEHEEELERQRQAWKQQLEETQLKIQSMNETVVASATQLDAVQRQLTAHKASSQAEKEELVGLHKQELEKRIAEIRAELQKAHEGELQSAKATTQSGQTDAVNALREKFAEQARSFQQKATTEKEQAVEKAINDARASMQAILATKEAEHRAQLEEKINSHKVEHSRLQEEMARSIANAEDASNKLEAAEARPRQLEADRKKEALALNEQVAFSQASAEASIREIQAEKEQMQSQLATLQLESQGYKNTIDAIKAEHEKAMANIAKSMQSSVTSTSVSDGRISELEKMLNEKNAEISSSKLRLEEELATVQGQLSQVEMEKQELVRAAHDLEVELQKKDNEMIATINSLEMKHSAAASKLQDDVQSELSTKLAAAEERLKEMEANHDSEVHQLKEQIKLSHESSETSTREIHMAKEYMESQLALLQSEKESSERIIAEMKVELDKAMAELEKGAQASGFEGRVSELEQMVSDKNVELSNSKTKYEEDLAALQGQLSQLEIQKQDLEVRLKAAGDAEAELQKRVNEMAVSIEALESKHAADIAALREQMQSDLSRDTEALIQESVLRESKKHADEIQQLKGKMADHVDKMNAQFMEKLNAERAQLKLEKDDLEKKEKKRESQVAKLVSQLKEVGEAVTKERDEKLNLQKTIKAESLKRQKAEEELAIQKKLLEDAKVAAAASITKEQEAMKEANLRFEAEMKGLREARYNSANKVEELTGKLEALTINLNSMAEDIKKKDEALLNAEKHKARLDSSETEVSELRQQITKMKLELTKNTQLANRLQSEKEASERNHGQRTALMGMLEGQLAEVNEKNSEANAKLEAALYDLSQKDEVVQSLEAKLKETLDKLTAVEQKRKETSESLAQAQKAAGKKNSMMAESLQKELQQLQQSTARKSAAAQKLIQEREAECASLRAANKVLQHEVDKGSLSDRKIFELAELQSNRESAQQIEIEVRDSALERLKKALLERDWDLASAENTVHEVEAQVEELGRVKRREDVNMDYLKSIVVQYLSKPPGTSERAALLPVLATLLQFDANDYRLIEEGKKSLTWFGGIEPKVIGGGSAASSTDILTSALSYLGGSATSTSNGSVATVSSPVTASAEISLSTPASKPTSGSGRTTSLQF